MKKLIAKILISITIQVVCFMTITLAALEIEFNFDLLSNISNMQWMVFIVFTIFVFNLLLIALYKIKPFNSKKDKVIYWVINICCTVFTAWFWVIEIVGPLWIE